MATKIRLQRNGRKSYAFYSIVIADVRAPRDGKFTEKIGTYNPNTNPATVDLNFERALHWVMCGAQPTDSTCKKVQNSIIIFDFNGFHPVDGLVANKLASAMQNSERSLLANLDVAETIQFLYVFVCEGVSAPHYGTIPLRFLFLYFL